MSTAYKLLDAYFKVKKFKDHYDQVKSIHDYAAKLEDNKKFKNKDVQFFKEGTTKKPSKGLKNALSIFKAADKNPPEWPANDTGVFYLSMLRSSLKFGHDSQSTKNAKKNYLNKCRYYAEQLGAFLTELQKRGEKISKHMKWTILVLEYYHELRLIFLKFAEIPSKITSAEQWTWVALSIGVVELTGQTSSCQVVLGRLEKTNTKTIKDCKEQIKNNQMWIKFMKSAAVNKPGAIKKNLKNKKPK